MHKFMLRGREPFEEPGHVDLKVYTEAPGELGSLLEKQIGHLYHIHCK